LYSPVAGQAGISSRLIRDYSEFKEIRSRLSEAMARFAWENLIERYDDELDKLAQSAQ
jgi:hypothetical protein